MKSYRLNYRKSVSKDLRAIQTRYRQAIVERIELLANNPHPTNSVKLRGATDLYRVRYADYRIIYQIDEDIVTILIIKVGHRREIYKNL